jgi:hypothetical protein
MTWILLIIGIWSLSTMVKRNDAEDWEKFKVAFLSSIITIIIMYYLM